MSGKDALLLKKHLPKVNNYFNREAQGLKTMLRGCQKPSYSGSDKDQWQARGEYKRKAYTWLGDAYLLPW